MKLNYNEISSALKHSIDKVKNPGDGTTWYRARTSTSINQKNCLDYNGVQKKFPHFVILKYIFFQAFLFQLDINHVLDSVLTGCHGNVFSELKNPISSL